MKACEIMEDVIGKMFLAARHFTVDTCKAGDPEKEVAKIGVCFAATPRVLRAAADWGADLLITHEPTFHDHMDSEPSTTLYREKKALVDSSGMTIYRYHDSMHFRDEDLVNREFLRRMGWKGTFDGDVHFTLDAPKNPTELAKNVRDRLGHPCVRLVGRQDGAVQTILLLLGARGEQPYVDFIDEEAQLAIGGETCEWFGCEPTRDAAELGRQKTVLLLGHAASEKFAMEAFAESIDGKYGIPARYFDCGDLFTDIR